MATDIELLERHSPIVRFNEGEYFLPASVESFVASAALWQRVGPTSRVEVAAPGSLDLDRLVELTSGALAQHHLRLVSAPLSSKDQMAWQLSADRPRFRAETRLGRVGIAARLIDLGGRMSLLVRGRVPRGDEAAAAILYRDQAAAHDHPYYGRVVRDGGFVVLQYWYFYFFNDWRSRAHGVNDHEGDWEQVTIFLGPFGEGDPRPLWVAFSSHDTAGVDLRRRWDDPDLTVVDGHPVVHAGLGSHAGAFLEGEYITSVRGTRLATLGRAWRRVRDVLLPWERGHTGAGLGIPYVDYKRGDGVSIGYQAARPWRPVLIDDDTAWVREYTGLWGNDTDDRFGGERGPAGPRDERSGAVRRSWADPVGWAALDAVIPGEAAGRAAVEARTAELEVELATIAAEREALRGRLRAAVVGGATDIVVEEHELRDLAARAARRADELHWLHHAGASAPPDPGPHAHLRVRPLPLPVETAGRRRFLRVWATVSTPLLFALLAVAVASSGFALPSLAVALILVMLTFESIARGRLAAFVATVVAVAVVGFVVLAVAAALFANWQLTIVAVLAAIAVACLIANLRELIRT